jgi:hypothetical protein
MTCAILLGVALSVAAAGMTKMAVYSDDPAITVGPDRCCSPRHVIQLIRYCSPRHLIQLILTPRIKLNGIL